jgi:hypothetical protein
MRTRLGRGHQLRWAEYAEEKQSSRDGTGNRTGIGERESSGIREGIEQGYALGGNTSRALGNAAMP